MLQLIKYLSECVCISKAVYQILMMLPGMGPTFSFHAVQDGVKGILPAYNGTVHALKSIVMEEGWKALYSGLTPALLGAGASSDPIDKAFDALFYLLYLLKLQARCAAVSILSKATKIMSEHGNVTESALCAVRKSVSKQNLHAACFS